MSLDNSLNNADPCESCRKLGTTICGNDTKMHSCFEGTEINEDDDDRKNIPFHI